MSIKTEYKTMTVKDLLESIDNKKIVLPKFQRDIVWTEKKRKALIDSLRSHFPIGSLLLAEVEEVIDGKQQKKFQIIDGLQRTNAIMLYRKEPQKYVDESWIEPSWVSELKSVVDRVTGKIPSDDALKEAIFNLMLTSDNRDSSDLTDQCVASFGGTLDQYSPQPIKSILKGIVAKVNDSLKIDSIKLPYIEFIGTPQESADAFEKLNTGSVSLNKYQIAAAQWREECSIENQEIKKAIKEYWSTRLEDADLEIDGIDEYGNPDKYLLFDVLTGLGKSLTSKSKTVLKAQWDEQIAFQVTCLALKQRLGDVAKIESLLPRNGSKVLVDGLISAMNTSFTHLEVTFKPVLGLTLNSTKEAQFQEHANLLIGSMAAALMTEAGSPENNWSESIKDRTGSQKSSLRSWYVSDFLRGQWGNAGDTLAFNRVWRPVGDSTNETILEPRFFYNDAPARETVKLSLDAWFDAEMQREHTQRAIINTETKLILRCFYSMKNNFFNEHDKIFHIDHLIPIQWWKDLSALGEQYRGPINSIGNLCLMETEVHSTKTTTLPYQWFSTQLQGKSPQLSQEYVSRFLLVEPDAYEFFEPIPEMTKSGKISQSQLHEIDQRFREVSKERWLVIREQVLKLLELG
jgi:hypothetical protein